jgi:hypothetical protein
VSTPAILRSDLLQLGSMLERDVSAVFRQVGKDPRSLDMLHDALPPLLDQYGAAASAVSADWYDAARDRAGVRGRFIAEPVDLRDTGVHSLVGWAGNTATDDAAMQTLVTGGMERRMMDYSRDTIAGSAVADAQAEGWQRVTAGGCDFCQMLAGRGAIYTSATADFASHDDCRCAAVVAFKGEPVPVKPYEPSLRWRTEEAKLASQARVRQWIATNMKGSKAGEIPTPAQIDPPNAKPVPARDKDVRDLSDAEVEAELERLMGEPGGFDDPRMGQLAAEMDARDYRRQQSAIRAEEVAAQKAEAEAREAWGKKPWRRPGGTEKQMREEYETFVEVQYVQAEQELNGVLLSAEGKAAGINPRDLFTRKRRSLKYASEELQEWFSRHERMSYPEFRAGATDDDVGRAARTRSQNRGWESEFG